MNTFSIEFCPRDFNGVTATHRAAGLGYSGLLSDMIARGAVVDQGRGAGFNVLAGNSNLYLQSLSDIVTTSGRGQNSHNIQ